VSEADIVAVYLEIALNGAKPDDPRLAALMDAMSNEELQRAKERIGLELLRRQLPPARPH